MNHKKTYMVATIILVSLLAYLLGWSGLMTVDQIKVSGVYKNQNFEMMLGLLEIWKKEKSIWKLWSRQSVEIKP